MADPDHQAILEAFHAAMADFAAQAKQAKPGQPWDSQFTLQDDASTRPPYPAVNRFIEERLNLRSHNPTHRFRQQLRAAFLRAQANGLVVMGSLADADLTRNPNFFTFTPKGVDYYTRGVSLEISGRLSAALQALEARASGTVQPAQLVLLNEAQECWVNGCYRAATILVGLACEEAMDGLADDLLAAYASRLPTAGPWVNLGQGRPIGPRLRACVEILVRIGDQLSREAHAARAATGEFPWWGTALQGVGALYAFAEAVRQARNEAAHDQLAGADSAESGLMLSSVPMMLEKIRDLRRFLSSPPVTLPAP